MKSQILEENYNFLIFYNRIEIFHVSGNEGINECHMSHQTFNKYRDVGVKSVYNKYLKSVPKRAQVSQTIFIRSVLCWRKFVWLAVMFKFIEYFKFGSG